ncbi:D-TA family PLP-dependent enzyme [Pedobacter psychroterrae]|uniref:D-TA family PLP-dependent enzyme n=2 Tax=Pedobacter psychroterrae TaxID=2530453 RepID=A0A4R0NHQ4_9SPHI|nr:D-TA family PLP-dependent enzyme [Pedobacter psychroterrae]
MNEWFEINDLDTLDSPALVFYPARIAENIEKLKSSIDHVDRLRPHVKTHKSADITTLMLNAGISKFKCATIAEAEMLAQCGATNVLLAYQPVGPKITRYAELISRYPSTSFSCLFDHANSIKMLSEVGRKAAQPVNVFLDLNIGMNRTGITSGDQALRLYLAASTIEGINMLGLHGYDGHIHKPSLQKRREEWQAGWDAIRNLSEQIVAAGLPRPRIIAGGTPTFPFYAEESEVECSPGTFILWDKGYQDSFKEQEYLIAAMVLTRVVSLPSQTTITVDLGHKAVAAENELTKRVYFINAPNARVVSQSEEHLVLEMGADHGLQIGDVLYALPKHICPTVALYERAAIVKDNQIMGEWKISSRDRKINI